MAYAHYYDVTIHGVIESKVHVSVELIAFR